MRTHRGMWLAGLFCMGLSACAVMSPQECKQANWRDVGLTDGLAGKPLGLFEERRGDCAEANVQADTQAYLKGREQGLKTYCRLDNALEMGLRGQPYEGVCPPAITPEFTRRHRIGWDIFQLNSEIDQLSRRAESLQQQRHHEGHEYERQIRMARNDGERWRIRQEFDRRMSHIEADLHDIDRHLMRATQYLQNAELARSQLH